MVVGIVEVIVVILTPDVDVVVVKVVVVKVVEVLVALDAEVAFLVVVFIVDAT